MEQKMFCYQCEQTVGCTACTGAAGVCGKKAGTAKLQDELTGAEISYGGDSTRSLKADNYFVLETEAQGFPGWVPYDGQLRLQAFSHLASGANMVEYWHWHSIHNSFETYWKGLLSHDFKENDTYRSAKVIGKEFAEQIGRAHV